MGEELGTTTAKELTQTELSHIGTQLKEAVTRIDTQKAYIPLVTKELNTNFQLGNTEHARIKLEKIKDRVAEFKTNLKEAHRLLSLLLQSTSFKGHADLPDLNQYDLLQIDYDELIMHADAELAATPSTHKRTPLGDAINKVLQPASPQER